MDCRGGPRGQKRRKNPSYGKDLRDSQKGGLYQQKLWLDDQGLGNFKPGDLGTGTLKKRYVNGPFD